MEELSYSTVFTVIESWEILRRKKDFAETMGRGLLIKFLQERPDAMPIFDFEFEFALNDASDSDSDNDDDDDDDNLDENDEHDDTKHNPLYKSQHFTEVGKDFITFVDQAVDMLGPADLGSLTDSFVELGKKNHLHQYNLPSKYYPLLGSALLAQLDEMLGPKVFTIQTRGAWLQVFRAISLDMTPEPPPPDPEEQLSEDDPELYQEKKQKKKSPLFFGRKRLSFERRKSFKERRNSNGSFSTTSSGFERRYSNDSKQQQPPPQRYGRRMSNESSHSTGRRLSNESWHAGTSSSSTRRRYSNESKTSNGSGSKTGSTNERRNSFGRRFSNDSRTSFGRRNSNDSRHSCNSTNHSK